jgi:hypothetical protein
MEAGSTDDPQLKSLRARTQERFQRVATELDRYDGLGFVQQSVVLLATALAIFSRNPMQFLNPQFYAEDGAVWYTHSLGLPEGGYLNTLQRLGTGASLLVHFRWAPLVMVLFGLAMQCLPVTVLLSARCRNWGPLSTRALLALLYVACPNARELHVVLTNCQWHLALAVALLAFGTEPRGWAGRLFDVAAFSVLGISGPYCILLVPLLLVFWWMRRQPWTLVQTVLLAVGAAIQVRLILTGGNRTPEYLGAALSPLLRIFGGNIVGAAIFGGHGIGHYAPMPLIVMAALGGLVLYTYVLRFGPLELKLLVLFCIGMLVASLRSPLAGTDRPAWLILATTSQNRYFFFPMLAFLWGMVWCARYAPHRMMERAAMWVLALTMIGVLTDWEIRRFPDYDFAASAERLREAEPGTAVTIPIVPKGMTMTLVKKGPAGQVDRW